MRMVRWPLALWALVVLAAHWLAFDEWQAYQTQGAQLPRIERLKVELRKPMALQAPAPPAAMQPRAKRLDRPQPVAQRAPELPPLEAPKPLPEAEVAKAPELPPSSGEDAGASPGVEWPLSVRLRYTLLGHYNGPVHGDAAVEWLRQGDRYQVRLTVSVGPKLAPLVRRDLVSDGLITATGVSPQRYDEETKLLFTAARRASLQRREDWIGLPDDRWVAVPANVQDSASQFVQLAWLFLTGQAKPEPGWGIDLPLALPRGVYAWRYEVVGFEPLDTGIGPVQALHLKPQRIDAPGSLFAEVWLLPELKYLPVQILIQQNEQTWVRLTLAEPPLQEEPSPQNAASTPSLPKP